MTANASNYEIRLSDEQQRAVDSVLLWLHDLGLQDAGMIEGWDPPSLTPPRRFRLGGLAGTGKTTMIRWIKQIVGSGVAVCAFTGRAAYVLRNKGLTEAATIHRTIYDPVPACDVCGMAARDFAEDPDHWCPHPSVSVRFRRKTMLPYSLIVVDEASMVNRDIMEDLESFRAPVLYVGDHGQLEPIGDNPNLMVDPDIVLETIHRQAEGSPILELAHLVRSGKRPVTTGPEAMVVEANTMPRDAPEYDVVICGFNKERVAINYWFRRRHGRTGDVQAGDRVVCLRNDHERGIFNGMLATVLEARVGKADNGRSMPTIDVQDDMGDKWTSLPYAPEQFGAESTLKGIRKEKTLWDFGYALTCHRAQGGEWDRVLVLEQIGRSWEPARWRYTAVTRAAKQLVYCVNKGRVR
jgi:exodeoxyribonuclease-5